MDIVKFQKLGVDVLPRTSEDAMYPNIDDTYTTRTYTGDRLVIRTDQVYGIKSWGSGMPTNGQGIAMYDDILVRAWNVPTNNLRVYQIGNNNSLAVLSTSTFTLGHGNALQFAPILESGQTFPYLYVAGLNGECYVLSIAADYSVSVVQTITIQNGGQVLKGDDGYIWDSVYTSARHRRFTKYRKVEVSEGTDITLTEDDILDSFDGIDFHPSDTYTAQGWKIKYGKIWYCYGAGGAGKNRGVKVYDTATHRLLATIDLSNYTTEEFEDIELYDNSLILATFGSGMYILKF